MCSRRMLRRVQKTQLVVHHATRTGRCAAALLASIHICACAPLSRPAQASDSSSREIQVAPPANVLPIPKRRPTKSGRVASKRLHYARRVGDVCTRRVYASTYQINKCPRSRRPRALTPLSWLLRCARARDPMRRPSLSEKKNSAPRGRPMSSRPHAMPTRCHLPSRFSRGDVGRCCRLRIEKSD